MAIEVNRLSQREDFPELIDRASEIRGVNPSIIEKDYYVTEVLCIAQVEMRQIAFQAN